MRGMNAAAQIYCSGIVSEEMHEDGGKHFHMAVKLDKKNKMARGQEFH